MNNRVLVVIVGIVILLFLGFFLFFYDSAERDVIDQNGTREVSTTTNATSTENGTDSTDGVIGYTNYSNSNLGFSIMRPTDSEVSQEGENRIKFILLGPENRFGTEITDGFTLTILSDEGATASNLRSYAEVRVQEIRNSGSEILNELEARTVNSKAAYRYSFENMLGSETWEYIFLPQNGQGYIASYTVIDPNNRGYQGIIFNMIESLQFFP